MTILHGYNELRLYWSKIAPYALLFITVFYCYLIIDWAKIWEVFSASVLKHFCSNLQIHINLWLNIREQNIIRWLLFCRVLKFLNWLLQFLVNHIIFMYTKTWTFFLTQFIFGNVINEHQWISALIWRNIYMGEMCSYVNRPH